MAEAKTLMSDAMPTKITGKDGKSYPSSRPMKVAEPTLPLDSDDVAEYVEMASVTPQEFEDALTVARAEGDLSPENVIRHFPTFEPMPIDVAMATVNWKLEDLFVVIADGRVEEKDSVVVRLREFKATIDKMISTVEKL